MPASSSCSCCGTGIILDPSNNPGALHLFIHFVSLSLGRFCLAICCLLSGGAVCLLSWLVVEGREYEWLAIASNFTVYCLSIVCITRGSKCNYIYWKSNSEMLPCWQASNSTTYLWTSFRVVVNGCLIRGMNGRGKRREKPKNKKYSVSAWWLNYII